MKPVARLGLYGLLLAAVFALAFVIAKAVVPSDIAQNWDQNASSGEHGGDSHSDEGTGTSSFGLSSEQDGYLLGNISAPKTANSNGALTFKITDPDGQTLQDYRVEHEKELHLIVVRSDGQHFRHVHPERDASGTWSTPWEWAAAGTYRVFADFVPEAKGSGITLSSNVEVAGNFQPAIPEPTTKTTVGGYTVATDGQLKVGESSKLTFAITRDGKTVTNIEPYLGAFGHLVVLRDSDLAYLHAHPGGEDPKPGQMTGPYIDFEVTAPSTGTYLLYLDFKVDGKVFSAPLALTAEASATNQTDSHEDAPADNDGGSHGHH